MNFIDLFAGCGGLSLGLAQAGLRPTFAIEANEAAFATYRYNLIDGPNRPFGHSWPEDWLTIGPHNIRSIRRAKDRYQKPLVGLRGQIDLVAGGPPCQGFSSLGRRDSSDPRNRLVHDYLWFVEQVQPSYILLENVSGMMADFNSQQLDSGARCSIYSGADKLLKALKNSYSIVAAQIFRASEFGVPQNRPRFVTIAVRSDSLRKRITEDRLHDLARRIMHQTRLSFLESKGLSEKKKVSCSQAISDLEISNKTLINYDAKGTFKRIDYGKPKTNYQRLMHGQLNGAPPTSLRLANHRPATQEKYEYLHELLDMGEISAGKCLSRDVLLEVGVTKHYLAVLDRYKPSCTISTLPDDILHYSEPRILTVRENARLQSFPDWFEFKGKYTTGGLQRKLECPRYTQVGNAVAPRFAEFLGHFLSALDRRLRRA